jgi:tRNA-splicing ligase RtcB
MSRDLPPNVKAWLAEPLSPDVTRAVRRIARAPDVHRVAVMPDVHLAADVCIGTVAATTELIYPAAVGGDIGCGIAAIAFDAAADVLRDEGTANRLFEFLRAAVPIHRQPKAAPSARLPAEALGNPRLETIRRRDGAFQLGTLGRGNHFLEFQADEEERLWLMVHSGSRAMGQAIRDLHIDRATAAGGGLAFLRADSAEGKAYLNDAAWARRYAKANRREIIDATVALVRTLIAAKQIESTFFDCDHNHVQHEVHFGSEFWVHRKGAMCAAEGEPGMIPGSMGTESFHVAGRGNADALCSSSHGAGRAMSRTEARQRVSAAELRRQLGGVWFNSQAASDLREEAPSAYKDVRAVMRAQADLTRVVRRLRPILSYKGI